MCQAVSFLVLFKVLLRSSSGRPLPLSAEWVLALGTKGVWASPELGVPAWELLWALPAWSWNLPGVPQCQRGGESLDSPSGNWTQLVLGPTRTLAPFITLLLPPWAW